MQRVVSPSWLDRLRVGFVRRAPHRNRPPAAALQRLFVDVTAIARRDSNTGIQRVVRSIMTELRLHPDGWEIVFVRFHKLAFRGTNWPAPDVSDGDPVNPGPGDVFLGLDLSIDAIRRRRRRLLRSRRAGARFWFVVYDLLPLQHPGYFSAKLALRFRKWLVATAMLADGYVCISPHVAEELRDVLHRRWGLRDGIAVDVIPMGFDIPHRPRGAARTVLTESRPVAADALVLAVGTLEPRKGYALLLDAFEELWRRGSPATLVIVGATGWKTEALQQRLLAHREFGGRLRWLAAADDNQLLALYDQATLLVAASYGEGFGLPVLEAIARSCPVLARDIPAFRAHAAFGLHYFPRDADAAQLADALIGSLAAGRRSRRHTTAERLPRWTDASAALLSLLRQPG